MRHNNRSSSSSSSHTTIKRRATIMPTKRKEDELLTCATTTTATIRLRLRLRLVMVAPVAATAAATTLPRKRTVILSLSWQKLARRSKKKITENRVAPLLLPKAWMGLVELAAPLVVSTQPHRAAIAPRNGVPAHPRPLPPISCRDNDVRPVGRYHRQPHPCSVGPESVRLFLPSRRRGESNHQLPIFNRP